MLCTIASDKFGAREVTLALENKEMPLPWHSSYLATDEMSEPFSML